MNKSFFTVTYKQNMASIYLATNRINGKRYVGFTTNIERRKITHKSAAAKGSNYVFHKAIRKYGMDAFDFSIIYENADAKYVLNIIEPQMIVELKPEGEI